MQLDKPNVVLPLANSYNTRGIDAYTNAVTNGLDQRKVNCIYALIANALTGKRTLLVTKRPGFTAFAPTTWGTSGQVAHLCESPLPSVAWLFSTSGNDIRVSDGSVTQVIVTAAGYKPVYVDTTSISGAPYVVLQIRNASFVQRVFYAAASDITTWTEITDADFTALTIVGKIEHIDGFAVFMDSRNRIYNLEMNSLSSLSASSYITKTISHDEARGIWKFRNRIIAFGRDSMEEFYNAGNETGSPLRRIADSTRKHGIRVIDVVDQRNYCAEVSGVLYWVDANSFAVMAYNGAQVEQASNDSIARILQDAASGAHYGLFRVNVGTQEALAVCLTTTAATTQRWLMYFPHLKDWFEWNSTVICPTTIQKVPTTWLGVGSNQHKLYFPSTTDNWQDDGTNYDRVIQFQLPDDGNDRKFMRWLGLKQPVERSACSETVQISDDDGQTWISLGTIDCTSAKPHLYRCGSFTKRLVRLTNSSNHERRIENFLARVE